MQRIGTALLVVFISCGSHVDLADADAGPCADSCGMSFCRISCGFDPDAGLAGGPCGMCQPDGGCICFCTCPTN